LKNKIRKEHLSIFHSEFREDLAFWVKVDRKIALRILDIVQTIMRNPFEGMEKPESLRYLGGGIWSRRITQEHRIVYVVSDEKFILFSVNITIKNSFEKKY
jgi:toxin YoeB